MNALSLHEPLFEVHVAGCCRLLGGSQTLVHVSGTIWQHAEVPQSLAPPPPAPPAKRVLLWGSVLAIAVADAAVSTPLGLSLLLVVPLSFAAFVVPRRELLAMALVCAISRILFGPVGDPLHLHGLSLELGERVQVWIGAVVSVFTYVAVALTFDVMATQQRRIAHLREQAELDPLTGLGNRRAMDRYLKARASAFGSIIAIDVDHFKKVNDTFGHEAGDIVLKELGRRLRGTVRGDDLVARLGGEEFVLMLPTAPAEVARRVSERIAGDVRRDPFAIGADEPLRVTVSIGHASGALGASLLGAADAALYRAKEAGRDRVEAADGARELPA